MRCFVCGDNREMIPYFEKKYEYDVHCFMRCQTCGLVINKTVYDMDREKWKKINDWHKGTQGEVNLDNHRWRIRYKRLEPQAELLADLLYNKIFTEKMRIVDFGGGDGLFSRLVNLKYEERCGNKIQGTIVKTYEKFLMTKENDIYYDKSDVIRGTFDVAICSAVLEHMIGKNDVDSFFKLVDEKGTVVLHTLICEEVPRDPNWFYIDKPVHCTLWTNEAMKRVYKENEFLGCAYHLPSKMWLFFKNRNKFDKLIEINDRIKGKWSFSEEFVDYWKKEPYHDKDNNKLSW